VHTYADTGAAAGGWVAEEAGITLSTEACRRTQIKLNCKVPKKTIKFDYKNELMYQETTIGYENIVQTCESVVLLTVSFLKHMDGPDTYYLCSKKIIVKHTIKSIRYREESRFQFNHNCPF
jgi:hypothetical protein